MWIIYILSAAMIAAFYTLTAQNIKFSANVFMVYRGFVVSLFLAPFLFYKPVIFSYSFYLISVLQGFIIAYVDFVAFKLNQKYGSEVVSAITPFSVVLTFFAWCFFDPTLLSEYFQNPKQFCLILIAICGVVLSLTKYQRVQYTREAFVFMLPVVTLSSVLAVLNKKVMFYSADNLFSCACQNVFIFSFIVGLIHLCLYKKNNKDIKKLLTAENLQKSLMFILLLCVMILKQIAMHDALNPAYVSCLFYTMILWVMFFSRFIVCLKFKRADMQGSKKWKIVFVASIALLVSVIQK